jgi:long-chain acyl-CoA synthetase
MLDLRTVNDIFLRVASRGPKRAILYQEKGQWQPMASLELRERVRCMAAALRRWGVQRGDRVIILAENRWEWPVADFATLAIGAASVPLYHTQTADQLIYMLSDSGAKIAVVSTAEQFKKVDQVRSKTQIERIVMMDTPPEGANAESFAAILANSAEDYTNSQFDEDTHAAKAEDLATIIYTSGTTGDSKGVMLTHGNIASNVNVSTIPFGFCAADTCISYLPLSHITARHLDYALFCYGSTVAYVPRFETLVPAMKAVQPTIFVGVPRVYEKVRQAIEQRSANSFIKNKIFLWAHGVGNKYRSAILRGEQPKSATFSLAKKLVFSKISEAFGGNVRLYISGGAPLGIDTAGWFADMNIRINEGYGLTETSPVVALNNHNQYKIGSVGPLLPNVKVRAAADGEIEISAPSVFKGYFNKEQQTAEAFTHDGWFKTGDIGHIDDDGFLFITDRKKELIKTSGGKFIAPQPIENKLKADVLVAQAAMIGDKRKFASVIISPNFEALKSWAKQNGISGSNAELVADKRVLARFQQIIDKVNTTLATFEGIKRFKLVPDEWTVEEGELTPSMKLKRRVIEKRYEKEIVALYPE